MVHPGDSGAANPIPRQPTASTRARSGAAPSPLPPDMIESLIKLLGAHVALKQPSTRDVHHIAREDARSSKERDVFASGRCGEQLSRPGDAGAVVG
jgi:hypothetical protein